METNHVFAQCAGQDEDSFAQGGDALDGDMPTANQQEPRNLDSDMPACDAEGDTASPKGHACHSNVFRWCDEDSVEMGFICITHVA